MPLTLTQILFLATIVLISNSVEAMIGFGASIIAVTLGAQVLPISQLVPVLVAMNLILSGWIVAMHWSELEHRKLLRSIIPMSMMGLPLGYFIFTLAPGRSLEVVFGAFIVLFALREIIQVVFLKNTAVRQPLSRFVGAIWLIGGGLAQGLFAAGGPMIVYYVSRTIHDKSRFRSTLSGLWLVMNSVLATVHWIGGQSTLETFKLGLLLVPSVITGIGLGEFFHHRLSEERFRSIVMLLLVCAGLALLLK